MKRVILVAAMAAVSMGLSAQTSIWSFSGKLPGTWAGGAHSLKANVAGDGILSASGQDLTYAEGKKVPKLSGMREGDFWLLTMPVETLQPGTYVELDLTSMAQGPSPRYFVAEVLDGGQWEAFDGHLPVPEDTTLRYTYRNVGLGEGGPGQYTTSMSTYRLELPMSGELKVRLRAVGPFKAAAEGEEWTSFAPSSYIGALLETRGTQAPKDTSRVLCIGNSFTYVGGAAFMLKALAWSQGHFLDMVASLKGGQTFGQHLALQITDDAIARGGYDYVFLQDQSQSQARYASDREQYRENLQNMLALTTKVRGRSKGCRVFLECTWGYPGGSNGGFASVEAFDSLAAVGAAEMAAAARTEVSPIGSAFAVVRAERPDIPMYSGDSKHQSSQGAYLKACVNYMCIFGEPFHAPAPDCGLDAGEAAYLRSVAERVTFCRWCGNCCPPQTE